LTFLINDEYLFMLSSNSLIIIPRIIFNSGINSFFTDLLKAIDNLNSEFFDSQNANTAYG